MNLIRIKEKWDSDLIINAFITEDQTILLVEATGVYKSGSEGNGDGLNLFSVLVSNYFVYEPIAIILDFRKLEYTWGNTILKTLNFFNEIGRDNDERSKLSMVVYSEQNFKPINEIISNVTKRNIQLCESMDIAFDMGLKYVKKYLD